MQIMELCIPHATIKVKRKVPWINKKIVREISKRNALFHRATLSKQSSDARKYRRKRNHVVSIIRKSKRPFLNTQDRKVFWKTVKTLNSSTCSIPTLKVNGESLDKATDTAKALNEFFHSSFNCKCPPLQLNDLAEQFGHIIPSGCLEDLLCKEEEVFEHLTKLVIGKSTGCDGISSKMLKSTAGAIASPLTKLFNLSISTGNYPSAWKKARVVPIPKGADPTLVNNYRPISILPTVSKILEKHVKTLIEDHLRLHAPISPRHEITCTNFNCLSSHSSNRGLEQGNRSRV